MLLSGLEDGSLIMYVHREWLFVEPVSHALFFHKLVEWHHVSACDAIPTWLTTESPSRAAAMKSD